MSTLSQLRLCSVWLARSWTHSYTRSLEPSEHITDGSLDWITTHQLMDSRSTWNTRNIRDACSQFWDSTSYLCHLSSFHVLQHFGQWCTSILHWSKALFVEERRKLSKHSVFGYEFWEFKTKSENLYYICIVFPSIFEFMNYIDIINMPASRQISLFINIC